MRLPLGRGTDWPKGERIRAVVAATLGPGRVALVVGTGVVVNPTAGKIDLRKECSAATGVGSRILQNSFSQSRTCTYRPAVWLACSSRLSSPLRSKMVSIHCRIAERYRMVVFWAYNSPTAALGDSRTPITSGNVSPHGPRV